MNVKQNLRICVDARPLRSRAGIGRYTREMVAALSQIPDVELVLVSHRKIEWPSHPRVKVVVEDSFRWLPGSVWFLFRGKQLAHFYNCDVLWGTQHFLPFLGRKRIPMVVTWHDVVWKILPQTMKWWNRFVNNLFAHEAVRVADRIVAVSKTTEEDLLRFYPQAKGKTVVVYEGKSIALSPAVKPRLEGEYLFLLGSLEPRKNIVSVLEAFALLIQKKEFSSYKLVVTGSEGWKNQEIFAVLRRGKRLRDAVIFTGFVSDEEILGYFASCSLFLFPSLYEGFGLPLVEAEGICPVVANDIPVFRELSRVFDHLLFCNFSASPEEIAHSLQTILTSKRDILRFKAGWREVFTWEYAAKALVKEMRLVVEGGSRGE